MSRKHFNGVQPTDSHPGAVALYTTLGNTIAVTLTSADVARVAELLATIVKEDAAEGDTLTAHGDTRNEPGAARVTAVSPVPPEPPDPTLPPEAEGQPWHYGWWAVGAPPEPKT